MTDRHADQLTPDGPQLVGSPMAVQSVVCWDRWTPCGTTWFTRFPGRDGEPKPKSPEPAAAAVLQWLFFAAAAEWEPFLAVQAVAERKRQVPYRNHKLTQLLQELRVFAMRRFRVMRGGGDTALVAAAGRLMGFKADTPGRMVYRCREFLFVPLQRSCRWRIHHRPPRPMKTGILFYQKLIIQIVNTRFLIM